MPSEFPDDWVSDDDIAAAVSLERALHPDENQVQFAERLISESAPLAARTIIHLATSPSVNDRVRLTASTYIIDRACGRIGENARGADGKAPWDNVFGAVLVDAEHDSGQ